MSRKYINRILVATDGSESAREAVELGVELAEADDAEVTFVHVAPPVAFRAGRSAAMHAVARRLSSAGDAVLDEAAAIAEERGVPFERELIAGEPADVIVALGDAIEADLIVVGESPRWLRLNVSRWVSRHSSRPVLIARHRARMAA
jgi:nucleotide-binding universal stress UspA family protein